jgi:hypothetical protein
VLGGPPAIDQVAGFSSAMRHYFYDAVRAAPSAQRVRALAPLADALDAAAGGAVLRGYVERIAALPFDRRAALATRYAALVQGKLDGAERAALIRDARAAHQDDLLLGALGAGERDVAASSVAPPSASGDADEYIRLAEATRDPWFELAAAEARGAAAMQRGDIAVAESALRDAGDRCDHSGLAYRCTTIWRRLAEVYDLTQRAVAAGDALAHARRAAMAAGALPAENELLRHAGIAAGATPAERPALAAAYLDELDHAARDH